MADERILKITAGTPKTASIATKEISTKTEVPVVSANVNTYTQVSVSKTSNFKVELNGYGETSVPTEILGKFEQDLSKLTDQFNSGFLKGLIDNSLIKDSFKAFTEKSTLDSAQVQDNFYQTVSYRRNFVDGSYFQRDYVVGDNGYTDYTYGPVITDKSSIHFNAGKREEISTSNIIKYSLDKGLINTAVINEAFTKQLAIVFNNVEPHAFPFDFAVIKSVDLTTISLSKPLFEQYTVNDTRNIAVSTKVNDSITLTDDVFGAANLDDDQTASFGKVLRDNATTADILNTLSDFKRTLYEVAHALQEVTVTFVKPFSDNYSVLDLKTLNPIKATTDTFETTDTLNNLIKIGIVEQNYFDTNYVVNGYSMGATTFKETFLVSLNSILPTSFAVSTDTNFYTLGKSFSESVVKNDFATVVVNHGVIDTSTCTETIANFSEKQLADNTANTDSRSSLIGKALADNLLTTDYKMAYMQNYFNGSYASPSFIGLSYVI